MDANDDILLSPLNRPIMESILPVPARRNTANDLNVENSYTPEKFQPRRHSPDFFPRKLTNPDPNFLQPETRSPSISFSQNTVGEEFDELSQFEDRKEHGNRTLVVIFLLLLTTVVVLDKAHGLPWYVQMIMIFHCCCSALGFLGTYGYQVAIFQKYVFTLVIYIMCIVFTGVFFILGDGFDNMVEDRCAGQNMYKTESKDSDKHYLSRNECITEVGDQLRWEIVGMLIVYVMGYSYCIWKFWTHAETICTDFERTAQSLTKLKPKLD